MAEAGGLPQDCTFLLEKDVSLQRVRGEGKYYYIVFLYLLCKRLLRRQGLTYDNNASGGNDDKNEDKELNRLKELVPGSLKCVCQYWFNKYMIDMFYKELVELLDFTEGVFKKNLSTEMTMLICWRTL